MVLSPVGTSGTKGQSISRQEKAWRSRLDLSPADLLGALLVGVVGFALRLPAVTFGLPDLLHPDEPINVMTGVTMADHHTVDPHYFNYPSMLYDVAGLARLLGRLFAGTRTPLQINFENMGTGRATDPLLFLELRILVTVLSVGTCLLIWWLVRKITGHLMASVFAGLVLAVSPLFVTNGVYFTPDTFSAFFVAVALAGALAVLRRGQRVDYLIAGLGVGLAAGAKYNAALVVLAPVAAHVARGRRASLDRRSIGNLALGLVAMVAVFVIITPVALLHPHEFTRGALLVLKEYRTGHAGIAGSSFQFYLSTLWKDGIVWPVSGLLTIAAVLGRWRKEAIVIAIFAGCYIALISSTVVHFDRDVLPFLPAMALLAGLGSATAVEMLGASATRTIPYFGAIALFAGAALLSPSLASSTGVPQRLDEHPRSEALQWIETHIPRGDEVVVESYSPWIPPGKYHLVVEPFILSASPPPATAAAVVVTQIGSGRFLAHPAAYPTEVAAYRALTSRWCRAANFTDGDWVRIFQPCHR